MKRRIIALLAALIVALLPMGAFAQTVVNNSGFQIQNLGTGLAKVTITYYNQNGTEAGQQSEEIPANSSMNFFGTTMEVPAGFNGSVVISSDQPVVAVTNLINTSNTLGDSYGGFSGGASEVNLPLIVRENFGVNSWIAVQNAGTIPAEVSIVYTAGSVGTGGAPELGSIPPGATKTFFQKAKTDLGARFIGSAKITSTNGQPVVAVVSQETNAGNSLFNYGGFTSTGATTIATPLVVSNNFGAFTGIQILNVGAAPADVLVTYGTNTVTSAGDAASVCTTPAARTFLQVPAGGSVTTIQGAGLAAEGFDSQFATCRYIGSATITSAQRLSAIVNQVSARDSNGSAYAAVDPAATTTSTNAPLLQANNFGAFSGIQVQNTGTVPAVVTVNYGPNSATGTQAPQADCTTPIARQQTIQPGASFTFIQSGGGGNTDPAFDSQFASCRYIGSGIISATGGKVTAIVNQISPFNGDGLFTYSAFAQQ